MLLLLRAHPLNARVGEKAPGRWSPMRLKLTGAAAAAERCTHLLVQHPPGLNPSAAPFANTAPAPPRL